jgi:hypothetical protein
VLFAPVAALTPAASGRQPTGVGARQADQIRHAYLRMPLRFEGNLHGGRFAPEFVARGAGYAIHLSRGDATVVLKAPGAHQPSTIAVRLVDARPDTYGIGVIELPGRSNHLIGNDPRTWRTGTASYARVEYRDVYPGVDLVYYGNQQQLEYDFVVAPGAMPSSIAFAIDGARSVTIDNDGNLVAATEAGSLVQRAPMLYQVTGAVRRAVEGGYAVRADGRVGFRVGAYDTRLPLVIDPVLSYSSYLGGASEERVHGVAVDALGNMIVVGQTYSAEFPTMNAVQPNMSGLGDAFIAKIDRSGASVIYATYLGGYHHDWAAAVDVDQAGAAYIVGSTFSPDFPTTSVFRTNNRGESDTFIVKLDPFGWPVYSSLVGGAGEDYGAGIAVDAFGRAHVAGSTISADFPTVNPFQASLGGRPVHRTIDGGETWTGGSDAPRTRGVTAFAIDKVNPETVYAGTLSEGVFKSTDGGTSWTQTGAELPPVAITALAIADDSLYAGTHYGLYRSRDGGTSWSPVELSGWVNALAVAPGVPSTVYAGLGTDGYWYGLFKSTDGGDTWLQAGVHEGVVALSVSGSTIYAATESRVIASGGDENWTETNAGLPSPVLSLAADPANPSIAYAANHDGFFKTTTGGTFWEAVPALAGVPIATLAIAPSDASTLFASSYWGGLVVTNDAGENWRPTHSDDVIASAIAVHPHTSTIAYIGVALNRDGFVAALSPDGSMLEYSSYFGGAHHDEATDIAVDAFGATYIAGRTMSADLPVGNAVQPVYGGVQDAFAARFVADRYLAYSTYLGGEGFESGARLAVDPAGQAHLAGLTWSYNFPVWNAHQPEPAGGYSDLFVSVLDAEGTRFVHSTYLGGSGPDTDSTQSLGPDVAVTPDGDTYLTGSTASLDFPITADAFQPLHGGGRNDAFVTKFSASGSLQYSTYVGGTGDDHGRGLAVNADGAVIVAGYTNSPDLPTINGLQPTYAGSDDGFVVRITNGTHSTDTVAPMTTVAVDGTRGLGGWYLSPVTVSLFASDGQGGSGVAFVRYSLNGEPLQTYTGPFTIAAQGLTYLTAQAADHAGNLENAAPETWILIDTAAPVLGVASPQARDYLYTQTLPVATSVSDATSGVAGPLAITLDGEPFAGSAIELSKLGFGRHTMTIAAVDIAGNRAEASVTFRVVAELDTVIHVPAEAATIQEAIDRAINGETVLVAPGTYRENVNFRGKAIVVASAQGPEQTVIDAGGAGSVVTFQTGETRSAVLSGFTIRGGSSTHAGGGIYIANSSPTIRGNVVTENRSCTGVGIYSYFASPLIQNNRIVRNTIHGCTGGWGIGVYIGGNSAAELIDNEISENSGAAASGGGVALFAAGSAVVRGNVISQNVTSGPAGCGWGGGIASANFSQAKVVNNLIVGNTACYGGGLHWRGSTGSTVLVNNTIADNKALVSWPGMYVSGFDSRNQLHNNIVAAQTGPALFCENAASVSSPVLNSNDVFSANGAAFGGSCADRTGLDGNVSVDAAFIDAAAGDYRVRVSSRVVDAGNALAPHLPAVDAAGNQRIVDGNGDGAAAVDIGALEYVNRRPVADAGQDQTIAADPDCRASVTLSGSGSDPDAETLIFRWTGSFGAISGASPSLSLPVGTHPVTLTVEDGSGASASDTLFVTVVDAAPPAISSVTATPSVLTRAKHLLVPVTVTVSASDMCSAVDCEIVAVTSNEHPENGAETSTAPDWEITGKLTVNLRAERSNRGSGRIYTITVACTDASGNRATSTVTVTVPR